MKILNNGIAVIDGDTHISKWVEESGRLDHDQYALPIILKHINKGDWVVDAGAFIGDHTRAYKDKVGYTGKVIAFEPNPAAFECLIHNCPSVDCFSFGLSDFEGVAGVQINDNSGASKLVLGDGVMLVILDDYNLPQLDFLKLDVEGFELKALKGAENTIRIHKPKMWIEINTGTLAEQESTPQDVINWLHERDYNLTAYPDFGGDQYDILCTAK